MLYIYGDYVVSCCFFFFKQKTAYEMRISDWSSDVCSSDLLKSSSVAWPARVKPSRSSWPRPSRLRSRMPMLPMGPLADEKPAPKVTSPVDCSSTATFTMVRSGALPCSLSTVTVLKKQRFWTRWRERRSLEGLKIGRASGGERRG